MSPIRLFNVEYISEIHLHLLYCLFISSYLISDSVNEYTSTFGEFWLAEKCLVNKPLDQAVIQFWTMQQHVRPPDRLLMAPLTAYRRRAGPADTIEGVNRWPEACIGP